MGYHKLYEALRYTIECRKCGGAGGNGGAGGDPCQVCIGAGIEAVSADDALVERQAIDGLRNVIYLGYEVDIPDLKELEV